MLHLLTDVEYNRLSDGREAPVMREPELRLERYAMAARYLDDLPNRPKPFTTQSAQRDS